MTDPIKIRGFRDECSLPLREIIKAYPADQYLSIEVKAVSVPTESKQMSYAQRRFYMGYIVPPVRDRLLDQNLPEETRRFLTLDVVYKIIKLAVGVSHYVPLFDAAPVYLEERTRRYSTKQFCDFLIETQEWGARVLGIHLPDPNEEQKMAMYEENMSREYDDSNQ